MEFRQVEYAIAVSEELTFTGAARRCGVAQPTITNAIRKLEQELGKPLFRRRPAVELTEFGRRILPEFYRVKDTWDVIAVLAASPLAASPLAASPLAASPLAASLQVTARTPENPPDANERPMWRSQDPAAAGKQGG